MSLLGLAPTSTGKRISENRTLKFHDDDFSHQITHHGLHDPECTMLRQEEDRYEGIASLRHLRSADSSRIATAVAHCKV